MPQLNIERMVQILSTTNGDIDEQFDNADFCKAMYSLHKKNQYRRDMLQKLKKEVDADLEYAEKQVTYSFGIVARCKRDCRGNEK